MKIAIAILLLFFVESSFLFAQTNRQEQINALKTLPNDTSKANAYLDIAYLFNDSILVAYGFADSSLQLSKKLDFGVGAARSLMLMGNIKRSLGEYPVALNHLLLAIEYADDDLLKSKIFNSIAQVYYFQGPENFSKSIDYNNKAIEIQKKHGDISGLARSYSNLGDIYGDPISQAHLDKEKSMDYYTKALKIAEEIGDKSRQASMMGTIGFHYMEMGRYDQAKDLMVRSLNLFMEIGNLRGEMSGNYRIGALFRYTGDFAKSISHLEKAISMAKDLGNKDLENNAHESLSRTYQAMGNYKKAFDHYYQSVELKFELYTKEKIDRFAEYEKMYEAAQREKEIELLKLDAEIKDVLINKQRVIGFSIFGGAVMLLLIAVLLFRSNVLKQRVNQMLSAKNEEILRQKEEIESQKDEIETQRDMVVAQKEMLENVHSKLTDSLRYAQSIQAAILPSENVLKQISSQYFVIMKPCEMVSGDFFWASTFNEFQVFCVADCTGHGVPGAFMSVLGISALNDIVARHRVVKANEILGFLRASVIEALGQNDPNHIHKDGLDIALCVVNTTTRELQFAGAGLPLWMVLDVDQKPIFTQELTPDYSHNRYGLYEIKGDIMPVGQSPRMEPFTNHTLSLEHCKPAIYLTTDGFSDQIGGETKSKYSAARLKRLIVENAHKDFTAQKTILEQSFEHWQGLNYQVDDVAVLGLKVIV